MGERAGNLQIDKKGRGNVSEMPPFRIHPALTAVMDQYFLKIKDAAPNSPHSFHQQQMEGRPPKPLTILYVTFLRYPNTGGLSHYITSLKNGMEAAGHHVDVLAPGDMSSVQLEEWIPEASAAARAFMMERYGSTNEKIIKNLSFLHVFSAFLKTQNLEKYDVIHAQDLFALFLLGDLNQTYQQPLFFTPHGFFTKSRLTFNKIQKGSLEEAYFTCIEKNGIAASTKIIMIADSFRPNLMDLGAAEEKLVTVHTGIDFKPLPLRPREKLTMTCVSRLAPRKGHGYLLEALASLREYRNHVDVWIVGDGVMKEILMKQAEEWELDNVTFWGRRDDIPSILSQSDIYVLPTINDNFPLSIIEAMHSKQAVISTTCGGIPEMVHPEKTGILCEPGNVEELARALRRFITSKEERRRFAEAAESYARKHLTSDVMTKKIEAVYQNHLYRKEGFQ